MKIINVRKEKILVVLYIIILVIGLYSSYDREVVATFAMPVSKKVVIIDAGHGGWDPGKVGEEEVFEKNINLKIAEKLQRYFEQGGSTVIITRADDSALGERKLSDMNGRKDIVNTGKGDVLISIHQNSYPDQSIRGAQAFYYNNSEKSKALAESVQEQLIAVADNNNKRVAKANSDYYILKQTTIPAVIVETGFMTNNEELMALNSEEYQEKLAWAIYKGTVNYFAQ